MCVCVCVCSCVREKIRIKSVVCEKDLSSVELKDFCLLRSILEIIARSFVNIKRKRRNLLRWRDWNIFYFILFFRHFFIQSYFNLNCYLFFEIVWDLRSLFHRFAFSKWSLLIFFLWVVLCLWIDLDHQNMQRNDQNREIYDSKKVCELHD